MEDAVSHILLPMSYSGREVHSYKKFKSIISILKFKFEYPPYKQDREFFGPLSSKFTSDLYSLVNRNLISEELKLANNKFQPIHHKYSLASLADYLLKKLSLDVENPDEYVGEMLAWNSLPPSFSVSQCLSYQPELREKLPNQEKGLTISIYEPHHSIQKQTIDRITNEWYREMGIYFDPKEKSGKEEIPFIRTKLISEYAIRIDPSLAYKRYNYLDPTNEIEAQKKRGPDELRRLCKNSACEKKVSSYAEKSLEEIISKTENEIEKIKERHDNTLKKISYLFEATQKAPLLTRFYNSTCTFLEIIITPELKEAIKEKQEFDLSVADNYIHALQPVETINVIKLT